MAEEDSGIPDDTDIILFAEDFINHVMVQNSSNYTIEKSVIPFRETVKRHFNETIKRAIRIIESDLEGNTMADYFQMYEDFEASAYDFTKIANTLISDITASVFHANNFLFYLANMSSMASLFYEYGLPSAPLLAESHIINVLQNHMPANGWKYIHRAAERYGNIPDTNKPSTVTRKSNEIKLLNQTQNEASGEISRIATQSSKNVSPEKSIVQQEHKKKRQKYETSMENLCSSGSSSAMGLVPLKGTNSSETESRLFNFEGKEIIGMSELKSNPRSDESNIDNEPILVRSVCKENLDQLQDDTENDDSQTMDFE